MDRIASPIPTALVPFELSEDLLPGDHAEAKELIYDYDISDWIVLDVIRVIWDFNGSTIPSGERIYCVFNQQASQWNPAVTQIC